MKKFSSRKLAYTAVLLAVALTAGSIEALLPPVIPALPFVRIGFSNVVTIFCYLVLGFPSALAVSALKSVLVPIFVGNPVMALYSLTASVGSFVVSALLLRLKRMGLPVISILGAITHNMLQLCVAALMTGSAIVFGYAPWLVITGAGAGLATGVTLYLLVRFLPARLTENIG